MQNIEQEIQLPNHENTDFDNQLNIEEQIYLRNYGILTHEEQAKLKNAKVTVIGAGGVGGITLISLARMGIGNIKVVDMDEFDYSNINRQMLSAISRVGKSKAECAKETINDINPNIKVTVYKEMIHEYNADEIISGSDVVVDATDNLVSRVIIHRTAQKLKIPSAWIAVTPPFRGAVMTFSDKTPAYELVLQHSSYGKELTTEVKKEIASIKDGRARESVKYGVSPEWAESYIKGEAPWTVICPVANIVGIFASFEVFKTILNRENLQPTYAPNLLKIDMGQTSSAQILTPEQGSWNNEEL
ncbi:HesA/MoeB/ThiF family protein [Francisella frigiditurris]|uniref:ThiF family protein n=1 Tax=Francisella frigiditurris TaxID=1542390 RepID=A0A1J0KSK7_9GAMM|nr:ThiF family adenylyltransferase [Francisella frigiditurris]APC96675.1 thiF family protein [Francisella frigiditurris]